MTRPEPRAHVADLPPYVPGRAPAERPGMTTYKVSSNENPYPPLPGVLDAAVAAAARMNRYPDMANTALYDALAARLGVQPGHLAAGTGSSALIAQVLHAFCNPGDEAVFAWRSFEAYPILTRAAGAVPVPVPVTADGRHDLAAMAGAVTDRTRVLFVCTPNNPTGPAVTRVEVDELIAAVPPRVLVVLDEAYREFVRIADPVDGLATYRMHPNVMLLRTFSKAHGLAGLRVGYAVAADPVASALRAMAVPFGVNAIAQAAAVASLDAEEALTERVDELVAERARVYDDLRSAGWDVPDPQGNFVWLELGERTAEFAAAAEAIGLAVRPFAGEGVRATVAEPEANDRLLQLAASWH